MLKVRFQHGVTRLISGLAGLNLRGMAEGGMTLYIRKEPMARGSDIVVWDNEW